MPDRTDISPLIREDAADAIIKGVTNKSAALQLFQHVSMKAKQKRLPIISVLPDGADFVAGDTGLKPVSEMEWSNKYLDAEPIACIVYLPEDAIDDDDFDVWEQVRPQIEDDIARKLDNAIFFGVGKPASWPTDIKTAAIAAGNTVTAGAGTDIFDDINTAMMTVEADGFQVNGHWARNQFKGTIRNQRDGNEGFLYPPTGPGGTGAARTAIGGELFGERLTFSLAGLSGFSTASGNTHLITGDWSQGIIAIRKALTWKMLDQAMLLNTDGSPRINLPQQDAIAVRVVGRYAWQVKNPVNRMAPITADRYPWGIVRQA